VTKKLTLNEKKDRKALRAHLKVLEAAFERAGGRGVELAEEIDEIRKELGIKP
jgi:hypothetical protein